MKSSILASLLLAGLAWSVQADETDAGGPAVSADSPANQSVEVQSQTRTALASHALKAVSARIGADLEARLERAVSNENEPRQLPEKLLVSTH